MISMTIWNSKIFKELIIDIYDMYIYIYKYVSILLIVVG